MSTAHFDAVKGSADTILEGLPKLVSNLDEVIAKLFPDTAMPNYTELEDSYIKAIKSSDGVNSGSNTQVVTLVNECRQQLANATMTLHQLKTWIYLMVPAIEDGNNFGVGVQEVCLKRVQHMGDYLRGVVSSLPNYYKDRAEALRNMESNTKVHTNSVKEEKEEGQDSKKTTSNDTVTKTTSKSLEDGIRHVAAIDVQTYFHVHLVLQEIRDTYMVMSDVLQKNMSKIQFPKGTHGSHSSSMSMY